MKLALTILCSLLMVGTPLMSATAIPSCVKQARACCHPGGNMACCAAKSVPDSQSASAVPAASSSQNLLSLPSPNVVVWFLPENPASLFSSASLLPLQVTTATLYARNCARLI